jgi:hypothetical protein
VTAIQRWINALYLFPNWIPEVPYDTGYPVPESHPKIANIIIVHRLNEAPKQIQIQILEARAPSPLTASLTSHAADPDPAPVHPHQGTHRAKEPPRHRTRHPRRPQTQPPPGTPLHEPHQPDLTAPQNDHVFISHAYHLNDSRPYNDAERPNVDLDPLVPEPVRLPLPQPTRKEKLTPLAKQTISKLASLGAAAALHPDVKAYLRNVVVFLRTHRLVAGGVSALATQHLELLAK